MVVGMRRECRLASLIVRLAVGMLARLAGNVDDS